VYRYILYHLVSLSKSYAHYKHLIVIIIVNL